MANTLIPKRSSVAGKVPLAADLQVGELAVNLADRKIFTKDASNNVVQLNNAAGVASFNTRTGAVTLTSSDVTGALGFTPLDANQASNLVPAGAVAYFAMSTAPAGWLKANGAAVSRTTYASLFAAIGTTFGGGDGSTTFNLPDLRGEFVRSWDDGRAVDTGRAFGSSQTDALQGHRHNSIYNPFLAAQSFSTGSASQVIQGSGAPGPDFAYTMVPDGTNGTPRTSAETRPRNIAMLACIKF